jgi:hypothetical protein
VTPIPHIDSILVEQASKVVRVSAAEKEGERPAISLNESHLWIIL